MRNSGSPGPGERLSVRYGSPKLEPQISKRDFTQHQLLAVLALAQFFKTDDRGVVALLADLSDLRDTLGLKKVPHHTTLFHARQRLAKRGALAACSARSSRMLTAAD